MALTGEGTIRIDDNSNYLVRIPARILHDHKFEFNHGEKVDVELEGNRLIITKKPKVPEDTE
jgi:antitoxin component of MazEF toxin-antitoxin module